ncbi:MAG: MBL fold metallo-hydrolase [Usitatibacter sp.]
MHEAIAMFRAGLLVIACLACIARAEPFGYERVDVAPGIYVFTERFGHAIVSGNSVVVVGDDAVLVVDTGHHPSLTRRMIDDIRKLTPKPVRYVVNTHWHADHVVGNSVYAEAFPGARFIATQFTAGMIEKDAGAYVGPSCQAFLRVQSKALREGLAAGVGPDGTPLTPARRARLESIVEDADAGMQDCLDAKLRGIDIGFEDRVTLRLGRRDVQVMFLGRANTAGDAVVYVPDVKVLAVGDILVHPFPFAFQSFIGEWAKVLRRIEAMDAAAIVPGHGPVMRDRKYLVEVAELMESIDSQVRAAYQPGKPLADVRKDVDLAAFRAAIAGDDPILRANFDAMADSAVARAWQERRGALEPEGLPAT